MSTDTDITPEYAPVQLVISVPFEGEPRVTERAGLADYLLEAILTRCAQQHTTTWELLPEGEEA